MKKKELVFEGENSTDGWKRENSKFFPKLQTSVTHWDTTGRLWHNKGKLHIPSVIDITGEYF